MVGNLVRRSWCTRSLSPFRCLAVLAAVIVGGTACAQSNPTSVENSKAGTTAWQLTNPADSREIEGYASLTSVNRGGQIQLYVNTASATYTLEVYRMGWYSGAGGRLVYSASGIAGTAQVTPTPDPTTGMVECNWTHPYTLSIPSPASDPTNNWTSGVYLAKLTASSGKQAYLMFVVRDDARVSDILFQSSVNTFQAYNTWGGKSLYDFQSTGGRASKVSFNRPYKLASSTYDDGNGASEFLEGGGDGSGNIAGWEYCMVRFLESNGRDVTYCTDVDTHENSALQLGHHTFLVVGHDEYWSQQMRNNVIAARDSGVNLGFFGGNICYWQVRFETSPITGAADRTLVCYKGLGGVLSVNTQDPLYTGGVAANAPSISVRWRDSLANSTRLRRPEEAFIGTMYGYGEDSTIGNLTLASPPTWLVAGTALTNSSVVPGLVGYESDTMQGTTPVGTIDVAHSPYTGNTSNGSGGGFADMTVYTAPSGATVLATGSIQFSWALDDWGAGFGRTSVLSSDIQTLTLNFLNRVNMPYPSPGGPYYGTPGTAVQFSAAGSADATNTISSYQWDFGDGGTGTGATPSHVYQSSGKYNVTLTVTAGQRTNSAPTVAYVGLPRSIWNQAMTPVDELADDPNPVEVGVKFRSDVPGYITGVQFWKDFRNSGTHTGSLWTSTGQLLATATFTGEGTQGWQQVTFSQPVAINAATTYVASYHSNAGYYSGTNAYFAAQGFDNPPLHALAEGVDGSNGLYLYGSGGFPTQSFGSANYWVDVLFNPGTVTPAVSSVTPAAGATGVVASTAVTATFNEAMNPATITASTFVLKDSSNNLIAASVTYNASTNTATLQPTSALAASSTYTATVTTGVMDQSGVALTAAYSWSFTTASASQNYISIWPDSTTPGTASANDSSSVEVGVRFTSDVTGNVVGLKFYKGAANTGTHTGSLWTNTGQLLATATFSGETATGWQRVTFAQAVAITAGTTYVASYHAPSGGYAVNGGYFSGAGHDNAPLHALADGANGANGVYLYGASAFPTQTYGSANYWVDVLFAPGAITPAVTVVTPAAGATNVATSTAVTATFNEGMSAATINTGTFLLKDASNNTVPATVSYNSGTSTATLTPTAALSNSTTYTATVTTGVTDTTGNALPSAYTWSFTTAAAGTNYLSIWTDTTTPASASSSDSSSVELGVRFTSDTAGSIAGIKFYKGAANTGTHTGSLWSNTGQLLATGTFSGETATGWQRLKFAQPVLISAGTTYVASYHAPSGGYASNSAYFASTGFDNAPLHALQNGVSGANGVYLYGASAFPTQTYGATNYWVDVLFAPGPITPAVTSVTPTAGATGVSVSTAVTATFNEGMNAATITSSTFVLKDPANNTVPASVSYNSATNTATLTPSSALTGSTTYTATVLGGTGGVADPSGTLLPSSYTWSFTTIDTTPPTVVSVTPASGATGVAVATTVTATFSEAMASASISSSSFTLKDASNNPVAATVAYNSATKTATLTPTAALSGTTTYTATVLGGAGGVTDVAGNALVSSYTWSFTTIVTSSPTVTSVSPTAGATGVAASTTVSATFSRAMNAATITTTTFALKDASNNPVAASVGYNSGTNTATLTPTSALASGTTYTATVLGGSGGVADPVGNTMAASYIWSFTTADTVPPTVVSVSPTSGATGVSTSTAVTATFSEAMNAATITTGTVVLKNASNVTVAATVTYNSSTKTATLTPTSALSASTTYTASVQGGSGGVTDVAGNALVTTYTWSFTTAAAGPTTLRIWTDSTTPSVVTVANDHGSVELGCRFRSDVSGNVTGVAFYKGPSNTGTHTGSLWSNTGTRLATATFTGETASGWQKVTFSSPVAITAGTTYVVSYHAPVGSYSYNSGYFASAGYDNAPLHALQNGVSGANGVYLYGASAFPTQTYGSTNYWVDVLFVAGP